MCDKDESQYNKTCRRHHLRAHLFSFSYNGIRQQQPVFLLNFLATPCRCSATLALGTTFAQVTQETAFATHFDGARITQNCGKTSRAKCGKTSFPTPLTVRRTFYTYIVLAANTHSNFTITDKVIAHPATFDASPQLAPAAHRFIVMIPTRTTSRLLAPLAPFHTPTTLVLSITRGTSRRQAFVAHSTSTRLAQIVGVVVTKGTPTKPFHFPKKLAARAASFFFNLQVVQPHSFLYYNVCPRQRIRRFQLFKAPPYCNPLTSAHHRQSRTFAAVGIVTNKTLVDDTGAAFGRATVLRITHVAYS
jgi:hypothetical protein